MLVWRRVHGFDGLYGFHRFFLILQIRLIRQIRVPDVTNYTDFTVFFNPSNPFNPSHPCTRRQTSKNINYAKRPTQTRQLFRFGQPIHVSSTEFDAVYFDFWPHDDVSRAHGQLYLHAGANARAARSIAVDFCGEHHYIIDEFVHDGARKARLSRGRHGGLSTKIGANDVVESRFYGRTIWRLVVAF
jgi:hypothetical protein